MNDPAVPLRRSRDLKKVAQLDLREGIPAERIKGKRASILAHDLAFH